MTTTAEILTGFLFLAGLGLVVARKIRKPGKDVPPARELAEILSLGVILIGLFLAAWAMAFEKGGYWWLIVVIYFLMGLIVGERMKKRAEELVRLSKEKPNQPPEPMRAKGPRG